MKLLNTLKRFILGSVLALSLSGCHSFMSPEEASLRGQSGNSKKPAQPEDGGEGFSDEGQSFEFVMHHVIAPACLECHSASGGNRAGINLETYAAVKPLAQALVDSVADDFMPLRRTPLTAEQKKILRDWVAAGALL